MRLLCYNQAGIFTQGYYYGGPCTVYYYTPALIRRESTAHLVEEGPTPGTHFLRPRLLVPRLQYLPTYLPRRKYDPRHNRNSYHKEQRQGQMCNLGVTLR